MKVISVERRLVSNAEHSLVPAVRILLAGCTLKCRNCRSISQVPWNGKDYCSTGLIRSVQFVCVGLKDIFLCGGEPLMHDFAAMKRFMLGLDTKCGRRRYYIETPGTRSIEGWDQVRKSGPNVRYPLDVNFIFHIKLKFSLMEEFFVEENLKFLSDKDSLVFEINRAGEFMDAVNLLRRVRSDCSPTVVFSVESQEADAEINNLILREDSPILNRRLRIRVIKKEGI